MLVDSTAKVSFKFWGGGSYTHNYINGHVSEQQNSSKINEELLGLGNVHDKLLGK